MRKWAIGLIGGYQKWISPIIGNNCRYYPSCSNYAVWKLETDPSLFRAILGVVGRIGRCNSLFPGGIDYPVIILKPEVGRRLCPNRQLEKPPKIKYWFVPIGKDRFYVVKVENGQ